MSHLTEEDRARLTILGRYNIIYNHAKNPEVHGFRAARQITKEDQALFKAELPEYERLCDLLAKGNAAFGGHAPFGVESWLEAIQGPLEEKEPGEADAPYQRQDEAASTFTEPLGESATVEISWQDRDVEIVECYSDAELRKLRCPKGFDVYYLHNPDLDKEQRDDTQISFLFIDWGNRRLYTRAGAMTDAYEWRQNFIPLLRQFRDIETILLWGEAKKVFDDADQSATAFNILGD